MRKEFLRAGVCQKSFGGTLKTLKDNGFLRGYASVFGIKDFQKDLIMPGAFLETLSLHKRQGTMPAMLYEHMQEKEVGRWTKIEEDDHGLWIEGYLSIHDFEERQLFSFLQMHPEMGLSIGFIPLRTSIEKGCRFIYNLKLLEISIVKSPANPLALTSSF